MQTLIERYQNILKDENLYYSHFIKQFHYFINYFPFNILLQSIFCVIYSNNPYLFEKGITMKLMLKNI